MSPFWTLLEQGWCRSVVTSGTIRHINTQLSQHWRKFVAAIHSCITADNGTSEFPQPCDTEYKNLISTDLSSTMAEIKGIKVPFLSRSHSGPRQNKAQQAVYAERSQQVHSALKICFKILPKNRCKIKGAIKVQLKKVVYGWSDLSSKFPTWIKQCVQQQIIKPNLHNYSHLRPAHYTHHTNAADG